MAEVKGRQLQFVVSNSASIRQEDKKSIRRHAARHKTRPRPPKATHPAWLKSQLALQEVAAISIPWVPVPAKVGNQLSWVHFPMEMSPYMLQDITRFFTVIMDTLYPVELCQPASPMDACWVGYLLNDPVVVHAVLFCAASVLPTQSTMTWNTKNSFHHLKALQLLQGRFSHGSGDPQVSDATLLAIVTLVLTAQYLDDRASDAAHVNGLYQVTDLRGGIDQIGSGGWGSQDLVAKMCRVDLGHALRYNLKPTYFREHTSWARCTAHFKKSGSFKLTNLCELLPGVDSRLADIWDDLAHFSHQSNVATRTDLKFTRNDFNDILLSIQYRLHHLALQDEDHVAESVRVAMLAISSCVFLGYQIHSDTHQPLAQPLQEAIDGLMCGEVEVPWKVAFWLVMTLKSLATPKLDQQLREGYLIRVIQDLETRCWEEAQKILRSMIWIDFLQDGNGRIAFEHAAEHAVEPAVEHAVG